MNNIGLIGLAVMGQNLALNIARKGYSLSGYNRSRQKTDEFINEKVKDEKIYPYYDIKSFVESLEKPRKIILMVKAGKPVDDVIQELLPYLDKGDLIIDGGNSYFKDTNRRIEELNAKGIYYLGMGVSGGEYGALHGPSLMPGGTKEAYDMVNELLLKIAAQTESGPCCTYVGNYSAGHFVKMVHNGIEYAIMQSISEVYDVMRKVLKLTSDEIGEIFERWNSGELNSFLMEISYKIMKHKDDKTGKPLIELILDEAEQKGTGKWTAETSLDLGIPTPSLNLAVVGRTLSFFKEDRIKLSKMVSRNYHENALNKDDVVEDLKNALLFSVFSSFSQGMWLISEASKVYGYGIDLKEVLKIWKGGCIIRAKLLDFLMEIISEDNANLLLNPKSVKFLEEKIDAVKKVTEIAKDNYIPMLTVNASLDYFYSMSEENLPANLIQGQRDFFGAHTYKRIDMDGIFHTEWQQD
ncbi:NADP-dependent phosphogluconate dehydrogenase [Thermoanaerobacterium thermosaccharolyticum]|uniref:NADP-dependent phosphogluconate dehydrogenase n=1 Tax=Thermoanaerobacterium thermosaccharolyticum TaxID=1517 RepID=UPI001784C45F|nr:NADP-dependent phosphogluconate dehydrogenase [Thermoanaerobacterium thermosaccharolyticum]MBE0068796.1 NADP-dependent phosphogluconate dehydrogenase [Thermoanaerobacterium thermosaccharolyticum]MBE0227129.1 NADP-dependent phosphogluconate dehydrogenase [Thermoanaerobacterium thermosaccharolyticum]